MNVFEKFVNLTEEKNIPFTVNFELTHRCNLRCIHCYLPKRPRVSTEEKGMTGNSTEKKSLVPPATPCSSLIPPEISEELTTEEVKNILDQLAEAGSLWLVFTGGEIFLREDFFEIAEYARKKKFCLTLFTNGTLLDLDKIKRLSILALYSVQISLYGASSETHDYITRVKGSFAKTIQAVKWLKKENIKVVLKTVLMKKNFAEYQEIIHLNKKLGTLWQMDPWITPKNDRGKGPLQLRINRGNLQKILMDEDYFPKEKFEPQEEKRFLCSAGKNLVAISPYGEVYPCLMWLVKVGNLREKKFSEIWQESVLLNYLRDIKFENLKICKTCSLVPFCVRCPGLADLEDSDYLGPSGIACRTAEIIKMRMTADKIPDVRGLKSVAIGEKR